MQLAVFDLDGTITRRDTLVPYVLGFVARRPWRLLSLPCVAPALLRYLFKRDRGDLKASLIHWTLGNASREQIDSWTALFVVPLLARGVFKQALAQIGDHRRAGDRLVLMSASVDLYVPAIGQALGFAETICTGVRWNGDRLDGRLTTPNCRGEEKVRCLQSLRERHPNVPVVAYGNSSGDLPHLRLAERGLLVNGSAATCRRARQLGIECARWS